MLVAVMPAMNAHDPKLAESLLKLLSQEQRGQRRSEETPLNVYERLTAAMILEIPWCHGDLAKEIYKGTNVGKYDECSAELRMRNFCWQPPVRNSIRWRKSRTLRYRCRATAQ